MTETKKAKTKRAKVLPDWFDLGKYRECEKFGAVEWYLVIQERVRAYNVASHLSLELPSHYREHLKTMRMRPLEAAQRRRSEFFRDLSSAPAVRPVVLGDLLREVSMELLTGGERAVFWERLPSGQCPDMEDIPLLLKAPALLDYAGVFPVFTLNLGATDGKLIESFKAHLQEARAGHPKSRKSVTYQNWVRIGLLPYLDLRIWEVETGVWIPEMLIIEAIYCHRSDGTDSLKSAKKWADKLLFDLSGLRALAAAEVHGK